MISGDLELEFSVPFQIEASHIAQRHGENLFYFFRIRIGNGGTTKGKKITNAGFVAGVPLYGRIVFTAGEPHGFEVEIRPMGAEVVADSPAGVTATIYFADKLLHFQVNFGVPSEEGNTGIPRGTTDMMLFLFDGILTKLTGISLSLRHPDITTLPEPHARLLSLLST